MFIDIRMSMIDVLPDAEPLSAEDRSRRDLRRPATWGRCGVWARVRRVPVRMRVSAGTLTLVSFVVAISFVFVGGVP